MARKKHQTPARPTPVPPPPPLQPGDLVGSYRITRQIGAGGMGAVYEAEHVHLRSRAAIKVLLPELSANPDAIKRFLNQARAASDLRHPRIVTRPLRDQYPRPLTRGASFAHCPKVGAFGFASAGG